MQMHAQVNHQIKTIHSTTYKKPKPLTNPFQNLPVRLYRPPSHVLLDCLVSIVQEAQFAGEEAGRSSTAACCLLYAQLDSVRVEDGPSGRVKGRQEREREREGKGRRVGESTCHKPSSQPALETAPNQQLAPVWCQSLGSQSQRAEFWPALYGAPAEPKSPAKWGSSLATLPSDVGGGRGRRRKRSGRGREGSQVRRLWNSSARINFIQTLRVKGTESKM